MSTKRTIIAVTPDFLLSWSPTNFGYPTSQVKLHLHNNFDGDRVQILNGDLDADTTNNTRFYSFYSDWQNSSDNYLLDPTPFSFSDVDTDRHSTSEVSSIASVPYKSVRLYIAAGWSWPDNAAGIALKLSSKYGSRKIELGNFWVPANNSIVKAEKSNLYIGETLYNSYIEFKIVDLQRILNTDESEIISIAETIFDTTYASINQNFLTDIRIEFDVITDSDTTTTNLSGANTSGATYTFDLFENTDWIVATKPLVDTLNDLTPVIDIKGTYLSIELTSSGSLSVEEQLALLTSDLQFIDIEHYIDIEEFDVSMTSLGIRRQRQSNDTLEWGEIEWIPILQPTTDSIKINVRTRIQADDTGIDISKFTTLSITSPQLDRLRQSRSTVSLSVEALEIVNKIEEQVVQVNTNSANRNVTLSQSISYVNFNEVKVTLDGATNDWLANSIVEIAVSETAKTVGFSLIDGSSNVVLDSDKWQLRAVGTTESIFESGRSTNKIVNFKISSETFSVTNLELISPSGASVLSIKLVK